MRKSAPKVPSRFAVRAYGAQFDGGEVFEDLAEVVEAEGHAAAAIAIGEDLAIRGGVHGSGREGDDAEQAAGAECRGEAFEVGESAMRRDVVEAARVVDDVELAGG